MNRPQTTKELARRIEPRYVRHRSPIRMVRGGLSFLLVAGAVAVWMLAGTRGRNAMLNPRHVSKAHAMWEDNCAVCHAGDGHGGFRATVSDSACLTCHVAPAHHANQLLRSGADAHNPMALAVSDDAGMMRSANCTACHVEHKGHAELSGIEDSNCTRCHANLKDAIAPRAAQNVMFDVTDFDARGGHPAFGKHLLAPGASLPRPPATVDPGILRDPTHLKFNHAAHMTGAADPAQGAGANCSICHVNRNRAPAAADAARSIEPFSVGDGRYMRPVRFADDCESCHELSLPGGAVLPHVAMELVQSRLGHPEEFYRDWLGRLSQTQRAKVLGDKEAEQWVKDSVATLRNNAGDWAGGLEKAKKVMEGSPKLEEAIAAQFSLEAGSAIDPAQAGQDIRVLSAYIAYANGFVSRCSKCHEVKELGMWAASAATEPGSAPADGAATAPASGANVPATSPADAARVAPPAEAGAPATRASDAAAPAAPPAEAGAPATRASDAAAPAAPPSDAAAAATQPAGVIAAPLLATTPTGIPDSPRRWFTGSTFNHEAHGNIACVSCHSRATTSTLTSDVLSPNLTWTQPNGATASCVDCHHPANKAGRGAGASCVTCHKFHDHTIPAPPVQRQDISDAIKGEHHAPATQPVAGAG